MFGLFWFLLLGTLPPLTMAPQATDPAGLLIEAVTFEGAPERALGVLASTAQIEAGHTYTEMDLRLAVYRLESLRFVLEAHLRLERGSARGAYVLRIHITPATHYFYALTSELTYVLINYLPDDQDLERQGESDAESRLSGLAVGRRWFLGRNGELNLFLPFHPGLSYTHYNVFHRNVVASVALQAPGGFGKNFSTFPEQGSLTRVKERDSFGLSFSASWSFATDQWLSFNYKLNAGEIEETTPFGSETVPHQDTHFRNHKTEFVWRLDRKDHPFFPMTGSVYRAGLLLDREFRDPDNNDPVGYEQLDVNNAYFFLSGQKFWEFRPNYTLGFGFLGRMGDSDLDVVNPQPGYSAQDYRSGKLGLSVLTARNLLDVPLFGKSRDFRLEAEFGYERNTGDLDFVFPPTDFNRYKLRLGVMGRDNHGLVRLSLVYLSTNEELWQ